MVVGTVMAASQHLQVVIINNRLQGKVCQSYQHVNGDHSQQESSELVLLCGQSFNDARYS